MKARHLLLSLWLLLLANPATAIIIDYDLTSLGGIGGNSYRYDYTVTNTNDGSLGSGVAIEGFTIFFDPVFYDENSLTIVTPDPPASDWNEVILGSGLLVDAAYDVFAVAGGVAPGDFVSGFAVEFTWLGTGMPGAQPFEIYDPVTFEILVTGSTRVAGTSVPEPGTLALLFLGAVVASTSWLRRRPR
jgi:hypothetical protein